MKAEKNLISYLMTSEISSSAQKTILHRKPGIMEKVIAENDYPSPIIKHLASFKKEILGNNVRPLTEKASDVEAWNDMVQRFEHNTWLELPWCFAEAYFYRRLLEPVEYFQSGSLCGCDPFQRSKKRQLNDSLVPPSCCVRGYPEDWRPTTMF